MTSPAALAVSIRKEARALLPMWVACAGALIVMVYLGDRRPGGLLVYLLGSLALASWSIGHEYSHRTLPILLSLPLSRPRLLLVKLAVVIPLLVMLSALALTLLPSSSRSLGRQEFPTLVGVLAVVCGLTLAPLLTMLCRSPIAGVVFAAGITGWVNLLAQIAGLAVYGSAEPLIERNQFAMNLSLWAFASVAALLEIAKHGSGDNVYLIRFHYLPPGCWDVAIVREGVTRKKRPE